MPHHRICIGRRGATQEFLADKFQRQSRAEKLYRMPWGVFKDKQNSLVLQG